MDIMKLGIGKATRPRCLGKTGRTVRCVGETRRRSAPVDVAGPRGVR